MPRACDILLSCTRLPVPALAHWERQWLTLAQTFVQWMRELTDHEKKFPDWSHGARRRPSIRGDGPTGQTTRLQGASLPVKRQSQKSARAAKWSSRTFGPGLSTLAKAMVVSKKCVEGPSRLLLENGSAPGDAPNALLVKAAEWIRQADYAEWLDVTLRARIADTKYDRYGDCATVWAFQATSFQVSAEVSALRTVQTIPETPSLEEGFAEFQKMQALTTEKLAETREGCEAGSYDEGAEASCF
ncbi:hypothetical protein AK812_SmicGene35640 [Symbiodinium microadriaticum]|uniref:Uncharacterized protein n=1 Tax=Symbiodinium microadriaticum TaxID=2951 RepID=A0A1Q9CKX4_SYMMI|nr:hypothetical protein AK812_SmicGene35640 [Symbiodinium microadriaticum]